MACVLALLASTTPLIHAQAAAAPTSAVHDIQAWLLLLAQIRAGDDWLVTAEVQPRWNDDVSQRDQLILRGAVGRRLSPRATLWGGYAVIPRWSGSPRQVEQRTWEQLSATFPAVGKWTPSIRLRAEQRFLDQWGDASHRLRFLGRMVRPLGTTPWSLALWDEYLVTLDDTPRGPASGFDQNRLYLTFLRKVTSDLSLEAGYLWQLQPSTPTRGTRHGHTIFTWITYAP